MCHSVEIGGNELAARQFIQAQLSILQLVVVDMPIKANNHRTHIMVNVNPASRTHIWGLVLVSFSAQPRDTHQVKLFRDTFLTNDVDLFPSILELRLLQVCSRCKRGWKDLLRLNVQPQRGELGLVAGTAFGWVVRHKEQFFAALFEVFNHLRDPWNYRVTSPDHTIAIKNENVHVVQKKARDLQFLCFVQDSCPPLRAASASFHVLWSPCKCSGCHCTQWTGWDGTIGVCILSRFGNACRDLGSGLSILDGARNW